MIDRNSLEQRLYRAAADLEADNVKRAETGLESLREELHQVCQPLPPRLVRTRPPRIDWIAGIRLYRTSLKCVDLALTNIRDGNAVAAADTIRTTLKRIPYFEA